MIAVLMGGNSQERAISIKSGEEVYNALQNSGVECFKFDWHGDNLTELWDKSFTKVFIILHGRGGEDGFIQDQLAQRGINFTGSDAIASSKCMNKATTKDIWKQYNLPLAESIVIIKDKPMQVIDFTLPWAVKPVLEGSSIGISKVNRRHELDAALKLAWQYDDEVLVEKWIDGDEYTVAIVDGEALPAIKILANNEFYDYKSKYHSNDTKYLCPCDLPNAIEKNLQKIALTAFNVVGAKTWGRVDFILDAHKAPFLLEINTIPGMTPTSLVPMAAKAIGISFEQLVVKIVNI